MSKKSVVQVGVGVIAALLVVGVLLAPIGPVPGFLIGGEPSGVPTEWGDTNDIHEVELEVATGLFPHVVIIWMVKVEGDLHVVGSKGSGWVDRIGQRSPVRLKMQGKTYSLDAAVVAEDRRQTVLEAYRAKYEPDYPQIFDDFPSIEEARDTVGVFRLTP